MSEYQYYEFLAIDKHLSVEEQEELSSLSSRANVNSSRASYVYNYGDFPADPIEILSKSFDAMFYISNWGSTRLAFYFPKSLIEETEFAPYCDDEFITLTATKDGFVLDINLYEEENYRNWIDGENYLDSLSLLRHDLMSGDYRLLYLAWLKSVSDCSYDQNIGELFEPEVPENLKTLSPELNDFIEVIDLDTNLIQAAAQNSETVPKVMDWRSALSQLTHEECELFLLKVLAGEANVDVLLKNKLNLLSINNRTGKNNKRTVSQIRLNADAIKAEEAKEKELQHQLTKINQLKELSSRENHVWKHIDDLIQQGKSKSYQVAVDLLLQLRDLSIYEHSQGKLNAEMVFQQKLKENVLMPYHRKRSLTKLLVENEIQ